MSFQRGGIKNPPAGTHFLDFWSDVLPLVTLTTTPADYTLNNVVVDPFDTNMASDPVRASGGAQVIAMLKIRSIEDTSGVLNRISTAGPSTPALQFTRAPQVSFADCLDLIDEMWEVGANLVAGGDVVLGDKNNQNAANLIVDQDYNFRLQDIRADGNNLLLRDVQTGLRLLWRE